MDVRAFAPKALIVRYCHLLALPLGAGDKRYYNADRSRTSRAQPHESVKPEPPRPRHAARGRAMTWALRSLDRLA